jgi:ABC-type nitrate/sulfonate/bicarbonate transport system substrate-binding protein
MVPRLLGRLRMRGVGYVSLLPLISLCCSAPLVLLYALLLGACVSSPSTTPAAARPATGTASDAAAPSVSPPPAPTLQRVVLHVPNKTFAELVHVVAATYGLFSQEGLAVTIQQMPTNTGLAAMLAGEVDYSSTIGSVTRAIVAQQAPFRVVAVTAKGIGFTLLGGPQVQTLMDLRGKPVGFYAPRDTSVIGVMTVLRLYGLDLQRDAITVVPLGDDAALYAALAGGTIAAAVMTPPFNFKAEKELGARRLLDLSEYLASAWLGLSTTTRKLAEQPQQVRAMIRANLRAIDYIFAHRAEVTRLAASQYDVDEDVAERGMEQLLRLLSRDGSAPREALEGMVEIARQQSEVAEGVELNRVFDFGPLEEVQRELGLPK